MLHIYYGIFNLLDIVMVFKKVWFLLKKKESLIDTLKK